MNKKWLKFNQHQDLEIPRATKKLEITRYSLINSKEA